MLYSYAVNTTAYLLVLIHSSLGRFWKECLSLFYWLRSILIFTAGTGHLGFIRRYSLSITLATFPPHFTQFPLKIRPFLHTTPTDRQSYNHPHEKTDGNQQESPVFFIFCDYNFSYFKSNKKYHDCYFFTNKNRKSETITAKS